MHSVGQKFWYIGVLKQVALGFKGLRQTHCPPDNKICLENGLRHVGVIADSMCSVLVGALICTIISVPKLPHNCIHMGNTEYVGITVML
jgi:hypothetical protein